ncbi:MAG: phosphate/phosphite/phosphonate ABC transporter substrate-binding protein [Opitutales bacterium]|nr:phosphate/phosphite/phosphonate ABC transporter substrate-binding protein [Opitutales bacterium]
MTIKLIRNILVLFLLQSCSDSINEGDRNSNDNISPLSVSSINIALKPNKNIQAQREDENTLGEALSKKIGIPVKISTPTNKSIIEAGLANKTIDIGYVSSSDAISFEDNEVADVLLAGLHSSTNPQGKPYTGAYYYSVWLCLKERDYQNISELKGKPIAFSSRTSTSGYLVPCWDLMKKGLIQEGGSIEKFFGKGNVYYGSGYVSAVEQVLTGKAEAAAVSYYVFEKDKHLTVEQRSKLKVIQRQGPVASHTFCVRRSLPSKDRQLIHDALIDIVEEEPQLSQGLFGGTLIGVNSAEHLQAPREAKSQVSTLKE